MVKRSLQRTIEDFLFQDKTILLYGARQTGKTTLVKQITRAFNGKSLLLNGDETDIRELFTSLNVEKIKPVIADYNILVIDEAQRINEIGLALKIIHDNFKKVQLIATGSSSFELFNKLQEPLTGRKFEFLLYPFSFQEMVEHKDFLTERRNLEHRMIYGYYPQIALSAGQEIRLLRSLSDSYLYKDLLMLDSIKKPVLLEKLLKALALQLGNEVNYTELGRLLKCDNKTIEKYVDLLEKTFVIFKLPAFSRNVRNEITRGRKIYFYDNGIRNAVIEDFRALNSRVDTGALWENFIISERRKKLVNADLSTRTYFWRTTQQQEVDYIEDNSQGISAYEIKWNPLKKVSFPKTFKRNYPEAEVMIVNQDNFHELLL